MSKIKKILLFLFFFFVALSFVSFNLYSYFNSQHVYYQTDEVLKTERVQRFTETDQYEVYGRKGTYRVVDSWWHWRFNSADVYGQIVAGNVYRFKLSGHRTSFWSQFPNILEVEKIDTLSN